VNQVLFICTGNYYRSRFAEAVFNHHAAGNLGWRAISRGLSLKQNHGALSSYTLEALHARGIDPSHTAPSRIAITEEDLAGAALRVALCETEHRPMIRASFTAWEEQTRFWTVADVPFSTPAEALPRIEAAVLALIAELMLSP
jgi:protein-tyrosine phosphatase